MELIGATYRLARQIPLAPAHPRRRVPPKRRGQASCDGGTHHGRYSDEGCDGLAKSSIEPIEPFVARQPVIDNAVPPQRPERLPGAAVVGVIELAGEIGQDDSPLAHAVPPTPQGLARSCRCENERLTTTFVDDVEVGQPPPGRHDMRVQ